MKKINIFFGVLMALLCASMAQNYYLFHKYNEAINFAARCEIKAVVGGVDTKQELFQKDKFNEFEKDFLKDFSDGVVKQGEKVESDG